MFIGLVSLGNPNAIEALTNSFRIESRHQVCSLYYTRLYELYHSVSQSLRNKYFGL